VLINHVNAGLVSSIQNIKSCHINVQEIHQGICSTRGIEYTPPRNADQDAASACLCGAPNTDFLEESMIECDECK